MFRAIRAKLSGRCFRAISTGFDEISPGGESSLSHTEISIFVPVERNGYDI